MKRVLIISSEYTGHGHKSVHTALLQGFEKLYNKKIECKVINGFKLGGADLRASERLYNTCVKYFPDIWNRLFNFSSRKSKILNKKISVDIQIRFLRLLKKYSPDIIISVHPLFNGSILNLIKKYNTNILFFTLITDIVSISDIWLDNRADRIISPSDVATNFIINQGIDSNKVVTFGIPVRDNFNSNIKTLDELISSTNISNKIRILILNNTERSKRIFYMIENIHKKFDANITVICGRNKNNYRSLIRRLKDYDRDVTVIDYTNSLYKLLFENDILITRCGSLSLVEGINCLIPIISLGALPGQEEENPIYLENNYLGFNTSSTDEIFEKIELLLKNNRDNLLKMRISQFNYKGRDVRDKIVHYIAKHIL